jgi:hypothetical protein
MADIDRVSESRTRNTFILKELFSWNAFPELYTEIGSIGRYRSGRELEGGSSLW